MVKRKIRGKKEKKRCSKPQNWWTRDYKLTLDRRRSVNLNESKKNLQKKKWYDKNGVIINYINDKQAVDAIF